MRNSIYLTTNGCVCWSRATSFCCSESKSGRFSPRLLYPFVESYPSRLEEQFGKYVGLVRSSEMSGWLFLKLSQRGKIFRQFVYCQRFKCVQNKSLDGNKTASFGPLTFMTRASTQGPNGIEIHSNLGQLVLTVGR